MRNHPRLTIAVSAAILVLAAIVGGRTAWLSYTVNQSSAVTQPDPLQADASRAEDIQASQPQLGVMQFELSVEDSAGLSDPQIYWVKFEGNRLLLVPTTVSIEQQSEEEMLTALMEKLLAGEGAIANGTSAIPAGTRLLGLTVEEDGVHVNVSEEFASGGGSSSMILRVAQVLYTATSIDPEASVFLLVSGQPIDDDRPLGGEGLTLRQPTTRNQFSEDFSLPLS